MADIRLVKPATGASQSVPCTPEARFVFDFPATEATLAREGDNLAIRFEDGGSLTLEGFYTEYNEENLPSFDINGTEVAAADFFAAMNEPDLMPAAGPGTGSTPTGGRFHEWGNADLADGIDHLNGLDWGFSRSFEWEDHPNAVGGWDGDDGGRLYAAVPDGPRDTPPDNPVDVTPENPGELPPNTPEIGDSGLDLSRDVLTVKEEDLPGGAEASGSMDITAPDGVASIVIGGVTVWENGALTAAPVVSTHEGVLTVTGFDAATGKLEYSYKLNQATQEHEAPGKDSIAHNLTVTVTDTDGDTASSLITVVIQDDVPVVTGGSFTLGGISEAAKDASSTSVADRFTVDAGADGEESRAYSLSLGDNADGVDCGLNALVQGASMDIHLFRQADGSIVGRAGAGENAVDVFSVSIDQSGNVSVQMTGKATIDHSAFKGGDASLEGIKAVLDVTDRDGDHSTGTLDLSIPISDSAGVVNSVQGEDSNVCRSSILLDFTNATKFGSTMDAFREQFKDDDPAWGNPSAGSGNQYTQIEGGIHWITVKGIKLIPTRVEYDLVDGFHADNLVDKTSNIGSGFTDKNLHLSEDGLGMGISGNAGNWGGNEFGSGSGAPDGKGWAEGFVIEPQNGSVWYELDVELSNFSEGDRAIIYFYLTPQNNNDNSVVYAKEVDVNDIDPVTGSIKVEVPDGFTKVIIAAMPDAQGKASSFTVAKLNLSKNAVEHSGELSADAADGVVNNWAWDWDASGLDGKEVTVTNTPGAGVYTVRLTFTGTEVEAVLLGNAGGEFSLNNNTLFKGHLDPATGKWTIDQFYKFGADGLDLDNIRFGITGADADGSPITGEGGVNMWLEAGVDRFDDVSVGYYNKELWGFDATKDEATDIMAGENGNDLMYGRGGNDILSGDGGEEAFRELGNALFGTDWSKNVLNHFVNEDGYDQNGNPIITQGDGSINGGSIEGIGDRFVHAIKGDKTDSEGKPYYPVNNDLDNFRETLAELDDKHAHWNGDDALYGGQGDDVLLGWGGNDFLDGGEGKDMIFAGSGNDVIVYDGNDFVVDGGKGIDVLLAGKDARMPDGSDLTLRRLLHPKVAEDARGEKVPHVFDVELLLKAKHTNNVENLGINGIASLAAFGIIINADNTISLDQNLWTGVKNSGDIPGSQGSPDWPYLFQFTYDHDGIKLELDIVDPDGTGSMIHYQPFPKTDGADAPADDASALVAAAADADNDSAGGEQSLAMNDHAAPAEARVTHGGGAAPAADGPAADAQSADDGLDAFLAQVEALNGDRDDALIFTEGNDVVGAHEGRDFIYTGAGNDLIIYDAADYLIDGGENIDFLLTDQDVSLDGLSNVTNVEVLLKGDAAMSLTRMEELAEKYGIRMSDDGNSMTLTLAQDGKNGWMKGEDGSYTHYDEKGDVDLTMETSLQVTDNAAADQAAQTLTLASQG